MSHLSNCYKPGGKNRFSYFLRVPILGMPIFADQSDNAAKIKDRGIGKAYQMRSISIFITSSLIPSLIYCPRDSSMLCFYRSIGPPRALVHIILFILYGCKYVFMKEYASDQSRILVADISLINRRILD